MDTWAERHRQLRLFISSTFIDMNGERDALTRIFPQIKELCDKRGVEFIPLDLRWGITEEAAKEGRVIETCLREIEDARPFFIGIIGHRYGWAPQVSDLGEYANDLQQKYPWLKQAINDQISITEMEMQHAALMNLNDEKMNAAFYIRSDKMNIDKAFKEVPGSKTEHKLEALKKKVRGQQRFAARDYDSLDQLAELVLKDVTLFVDRAFPIVEVSSFDRDAELQERILKSRLNSLIPLQRYQPQIDKWLNEKTKRDILITGKVGVGKSYVLAHVVQQLRKRGEKVIYADFSELDLVQNLEYVTGEMLCQLGVKNRKQVEKEAIVSGVFFSIWQIISFLIKYTLFAPFRQAFGSSNSLHRSFNKDFKATRTSIEVQTLKKQTKKLGKVLAKQPDVVLYVALDNMDGLTSKDLYIFNVFAGTNQIRLLTTASTSSNTSEHLQSTSATEMLEVHNLNIHQAASYVNNYLAQHGKMLDARGEQCGKLMRSGVAGNALMLNHILQLMVRFGSHEKLENYIYELSNIKNEHELYVLITRHILSQYDKADQLKTAKEIIAILTAAKEGLTESEIQDILKPNPMEWALLRPYLFSICRCKDKRWKPANEVCRKALQQAVEDRNMWSVSELSDHFEATLKACVLHFNEMGTVDNHKILNDFNLLRRQVEVLTELYYENEHWEDLFYWATYVYGDGFMKEDQRVRYWKALYQAGYNMRTSGNVDVPPYIMRKIIHLAKQTNPNIKKCNCDSYIRLYHDDHQWRLSEIYEKHDMFKRWASIASIYNIVEDVAWVNKQISETSD